MTYNVTGMFAMPVTAAIAGILIFYFSLNSFNRIPICSFSIVPCVEILLLTTGLQFLFALTISLLILLPFFLTEMKSKPNEIEISIQHFIVP